MPILQTGSCSYSKGILATPWWVDGMQEWTSLRLDVEAMGGSGGRLCRSAHTGRLTRFRRGSRLGVGHSKMRLISEHVESMDLLLEYWRREAPREAELARVSGAA